MKISQHKSEAKGMCKGMWIYQIGSARKEGGYERENFRSGIWEGEALTWPYGDKKGQKPPAIGDTLVFFYAPTGEIDAGVYGWAVVMNCNKKKKTVHFIPTTPTDYLKMVPWWNEHAKKLLTEIRSTSKGKLFPKGTLFLVPKNKTSSIREGIKTWLGQ